VAVGFGAAGTLLSMGGAVFVLSLGAIGSINLSIQYQFVISKTPFWIHYLHFSHSIAFASYINQQK
jgi:hypothetical protein